MYYRILDGDVRAQSDSGASIELSPQQQHALLLLITARGQTMRSDVLAMHLVADASDPRSAIRTLMSRLRRQLGKDSQCRYLLSGEGARENHRYTLRLQPGDYVDLSVFRLMVERAEDAYETDPAMAALLLEEALRKWPELVLGLPPSVAALRTQLMHERLNAVERLAELQLWLGRYRHLTLWLPEVVHAHPERENLLATLMHALYRAGRGAEARRLYDDLAAQLKAELGSNASPGDNLKEVYDLISKGQAPLNLRPVPVPEPDQAVQRSGGDTSTITTTKIMNYIANLGRVNSPNEFHDAASRAATEHVVAVIPQLLDLEIETERLRGRLARWFALEHQPRISQFVEIGANVPSRYSLHGALGVIASEALVAYFNQDPAVVTHSNQLLENEGNVTFTVGELRDPDAIILALEKNGFDLNKPVGVIMLEAVNYTTPEEKPRELIRYLTDRLAPGSAVAVNMVVQEGMTNAVTELINSTYRDSGLTLVPRTMHEASQMLNGDGLRPTEPVCDIGDWHPTRPSPPHGPMRAVIAVAKVVDADGPDPYPGA